MATISTPKNLYIHYKEESVARTDTSAKDLFVLPAGSTPLALLIRGETASNAGTTAVLDVGITGTAEYFIADTSVLAAGGGASSNFKPMLKGRTQLTTDTTVTATYAESGTASTVGGPWTVGIFYIRA